ncbi:MAG: TolC family protein [Desulfobulbaceae bacterium]|jgi:cobalt-zinc-cadmium efflux system outer membrane protein|nr:TolC family protein [Desulfobulbaceae bacterium]
MTFVFQKNTLATIFCCLLLLQIGLTDANADPPLFLEQAVEESLAANPGLEAIKARADALAHIPEQRGSLPDPKLTLGIANLPLDSFSTTQENMTQMQVGLSQGLPFPGKLALMEESARQESLAAVADVDEEQLHLVKDVKTVWWNLFFLDRAIETVKRNRELLHQLVTISQTKYQVGKGLQQDVLLAQLELSKLLDAKIDLQNTRQNQVSRLNALLNRPIDQVINLPDSASTTLPTLLPLEALQGNAQKIRPLLIGLDKKIEASRAKVDLAHKDYYPDFTVGAIYGHRNGQNLNGTDRADFGSLGVTMTLPFFDRTSLKNNLSQRNSEKLQWVYALKNSRNMVAAEVANAVTDYKQTAEQSKLYQGGIIPQAKQTVDSMLAGYQVNKVDFLNLIGAQTSLYNYETKYWKAFSSAQQALARLVAATGTENINE